jgi:hypothetical protein
MISVESQGGDLYRVTVTEGGSSTTHTVELDQDYYQKLSGPAETEEDLIRRSFEFLLAREPKESILSRFHLSVIARYFPDYERSITAD